MKKLKIIALFVGMLSCFFALGVMAINNPSTPVTGGIGTVANNLRSSFGIIADLISAASYILGFGLIVASLFKFKQHKETPQQVHLGQPIMMVFLAVALIFLPSVLETGGKSLFGSKATTGGPYGTSGIPSVNTSGAGNVVDTPT